MKLTVNPASGRVYARLKTPNPDKPTIRISLGTTSLAEAKKKAKGAKLSEIESALQLGRLSQEAIARVQHGGKLTVEQAIERWLERAKARGEAPSTTFKNRATIDQWFEAVPAVKSLSPMALAEEHIAPFVNRTAAAGVATRRRQLSILRTFLRYCADQGLTHRNPAADLKVTLHNLSHRQKEAKKVQPFTEDEVNRILAGTEGFWRWASGIAAATGMRLGDIAQLEHASFEVPGHVIAWTEKRDRRICLPISETITPGLIAILSEIPASDSPYLFPDEKRQYDDIQSGRAKFSVYFGRILERLGIEHRSFHCFRHYAITRWKNAGFSMDHCAEYAGHASKETTKGYAH